jgi:glutathione peroxidase
MTLLDTELSTLAGQPTTLDTYAGGAMLIVNVASKCGLTPQYTGLQALHTKYHGQGFTVVGFPCNQFGAQEPGSADEIAEFCATNFGVSFPMMSKVDVNGPDRNPVYDALTAVADAEGHSGDIRWNFEKFLVGHDGTITRFSPMVAPDDATLVAAIEAALPTERVSASRRIAAPIAAIYHLVADPAGHVRIDGSGMLDDAADSRPLTAVGDTFRVAMDRTPLNDIPELVKYEVENTVTRIIPNRLVEWTVGPVGQPPYGHRYGWLLEPVDGNTTDVTNYCDWSEIIPALRERRPDWPIVPVAMLEETVARLDQLVTG